MARSFRVAVSSLMLVAALALTASVASAAVAKPRHKAVDTSLGQIEGKSGRYFRTFYWIFNWFYND